VRIVPTNRWEVTLLRYVLTRFAIWIPSVLIVMLAVYALAFYGAGDPIKLIFLRAPGDVAYNPQRIEAIRESAGLNKPFIEQFGPTSGTCCMASSAIR
jgi:peptide/nickel transport system permease protein